MTRRRHAQVADRFLVPPKAIEDLNPELTVDVALDYVPGGREREREGGRARDVLLEYAPGGIPHLDW
jgi:hypothetical protein